jgi:iron complex outermembrane receptor protein
MGGKLEWITGIYLSVEDVQRSQFRPRRLTVATFGPPPGAVSAPKWSEDVTRKTAALFGQATYAITNKLNFTGGLRWTYDKIDFSTQLTDPLGFANVPGGSLNPATELFGPTDSKESWKEFTWTAGLDYSIDEDVMVYALYSRGFKGGGYQGTPPNEAAAIEPFDPETADNYEIGIKSQLFDKTVLFNLSAFHVEFKDLQLIERQELVPGDPTTAVLSVFNAASAKIDGIEFEAMWATPVEGLQLSVAGGLLDTNIGQAINPLNVDRDLPQAPDFSATFAADYSHDISDDTIMDMRVAYRYTGDFWWDLANKEPGFEKGYGLLDASIGITHGPWTATLWGKNLTKTKYRSYAQSILQDVVDGQQTNMGGAAVSRIGDPRTWGLTITRSFDW